MPDDLDDSADMVPKEKWSGLCTLKQLGAFNLSMTDKDVSWHPCSYARSRQNVNALRVFKTFPEHH